MAKLKIILSCLIANALLLVVSTSPANSAPASFVPEGSVSASVVALDSGFSNHLAKRGHKCHHKHRSRSRKKHRSRSRSRSHHNHRSRSRSRSHHNHRSRSRKNHRSRCHSHSA
ncbi:hypothetical protein G9A89_019644 [Geosiphon pyriformis]|nr:hypothetical protein G9A89_019644 [Geosiphon pyriformis]